jgi:glycosyltransferase involved in cell wall biosynthesis
LADSPPTITVAIPTYNGERHIVECLRGILAQEDASFDLLVCDDRSDDRTLDLVRAEAGDRARIVIGSERLGLAANWNRCMAESRTPWVAVFHQDDVMRPEHLRDHLRAIREDERASSIDGPAIGPLGLIASPSGVIDASSKAMSVGVIEQGSFPIPRSIDPNMQPDGWIIVPAGETSWLSLRNPLRCSAMTTSKRAHEAVGGFDPSYRYVVDWDFWIRVCERFALAFFQGPATVSVRWHAASETHRFKATFDDLEESERLARNHQMLGQPDVRLRLGRAYLNRAYDALHAGRIELAREALRRSVRIKPSMIATILADPRLAAQMGMLALAPGVAQRWYRSESID